MTLLRKLDVTGRYWAIMWLWFLFWMTLYFVEDGIDAKPLLYLTCLILTTALIQNRLHIAWCYRVIERDRALVDALIDGDVERARSIMRRSVP